MPDLIESQEAENDAVILEVLSDAPHSAVEAAVSAGISLSAAERSLARLMVAGRVKSIKDGETFIWSRT